MISALTVSNRPEWMPFCRHQVEKQANYFASEHIVITPESNETVGAARSRALAAAKEDYVAWFDDDDWSSQWRLSSIYNCTDEYGGAVVAIAGNWQSWMVNAETMKALRYPGYGYAIFNGGLFLKDAMPKEFSDISQGEDVEWVRRGYERGARILLEPKPMAVWLCHGKNLVNKASLRIFDQPLPAEVQFSERDLELIPR